MAPKMSTLRQSAHHVKVMKCGFKIINFEKWTGSGTFTRQIEHRSMYFVRDGVSVPFVQIESV